MKKFVVFVDHQIGHTTLEYLLLHHKKQVHAVVTTLQNDEGWWPSVRELVEKHQIPFFTYPIDENAEEYIKNSDYFFLLSWKHILELRVIRLAKLAVINLHYSLLPKYRGVYPINRALINGEKESGVTFHLVDSGVDTGPILKQKSIAIEPTDTAQSLLPRLDQLALELFVELIAEINNDALELSQFSRIESRKEDYMSAREFRATDCLNLNKIMSAGEFINLLRGKTFFSEKPQLFFIDPFTRKKVFLSIRLSAELPEGNDPYEQKNSV